ncbi:MULTISPECIES: bis-aminopropyl spermidine synthase family protein [unclassified Amycolatopsis]|uniref:bis-aminopropyl spermidine synthase family protein n=1 Tax=unclassified Amycolatopsis TaxID=2618356 RepID=UPI0028761A04|nr:MULTISPECIES: bis-aminopropyl spermidine synthase family protein [unclassified Amycolatopsis]MDS0139280.1 bis-aminopropyl spermidine synthase family protein [Amycolatopsis sp. 505]MDS0144512.1 bis-aminopropyl spermidine synthase family protein [Amycolatopsis sp. CM201R]
MTIQQTTTTNDLERREQLEQLAKIVAVLDRLGPSTIPELLRHTMRADRQLIPLLALGIERGQVSRDGDHYRTPQATAPEIGKLAATLFNPHEAFLHSGQGRALLDRLADVAQGRPSEEHEFQQRHVSLRTSLLRALYLAYRGDVHGKKIVLLGDDDLTGLALCLIGGFAQLVVLEADPQLVAFITDRVARLGAENVEVRVYDAHDEVPADLAGAADTYLCDPTRKLYQVFLERGIALLRPSGVLYSFVNPSHSHPVGQFIFQRAALDLDWVLTDVVPAFNEYRRQPGSLTPEEEAFYSPEDDDEAVSFTESLVRFVKGAGREAEAEMMKWVDSGKPAMFYRPGPA